METTKRPWVVLSVNDFPHNTEIYIGLRERQGGPKIPGRYPVKLLLKNGAGGESLPVMVQNDGQEQEDIYITDGDYKIQGWNLTEYYRQGFDTLAVVFNGQEVINRKLIPNIQKPDTEPAKRLLTPDQSIPAKTNLRLADIAANVCGGQMVEEKYECKIRLHLTFADGNRLHLDAVLSLPLGQSVECRWTGTDGQVISNILDITAPRNPASELLSQIEARFDPTSDDRGCFYGSVITRGTDGKIRPRPYRVESCTREIIDFGSNGNMLDRTITPSSKGRRLCLTFPGDQATLDFYLEDDPSQHCRVTLVKD